jgi:hypothetical protein
MEKQDKQLIEKVESQCNVKLSTKEKMIVLVAFRDGIVEGYDRGLKIVRETL